MYDHIGCETCNVIDFRTAWLYSSEFVYRVLQPMTVGYSEKKKTGSGIIICQDSQVPPVGNSFIMLHSSVLGH